jgi:peptidoglycan/xylan/chitin deacetylase (PgdA/CDA1 family)
VRAVSLLYHDVVENSDWDCSGFTGPGTARYKLNRHEFEAHLKAIAALRKDPAMRAHELMNPDASSFPFLLTFDDGGESASRVAGLLSQYEWCGHFFVTAGKIGDKGFLGRGQIRDLRKNGHVIGSHSFSHPVRMSQCSEQKLVDEWTTSLHVLSDILGEPVDTASVPGGYYSRRVAETAAASGIRVLFNSEPTTKIQVVSGCVLVGRYNIFRGTPASLSGELVSARSVARPRQWLFWNIKKAAKKVAGRPYLAARELLLRKG